MKSEGLRAAILGAGYISKFHLNAIEKRSDVNLVAVCDLNSQLASQLVGDTSGVVIYTDLEKMLSECSLDVVHVLTQPDSHYFLTKKILDFGCNVVVEKPFVTNLDEALELTELAKDKQLGLAINHNFVFSRPFNKLKEILNRGDLGPIKSVRVVWKKVLAPTSYGPWDLWMLRNPGNIMLETGSHSISELLSVTTSPEIISVDILKKKKLPSGVDFYLQWKIAARSGAASIDVHCSFDQGYEQHFVEVEGLFGVAVADIENDIFELDMNTGHAYDIERLNVNLKRGKSIAGQALSTFASYGISKFNNRALGGAYEASMLSGINTCYEEILNKAKRIENSPGFAVEVTRLASMVCAKLPDSSPAESRAPLKLTPTTRTPSKEGSILIIGATGFIGKRLFVELQKQNRSVRALVRNASKLTDVEISENCEVMLGDYRDQSVMETALDGIETVFHLAVSHSNSLEGYLQSNHEPTLRLAQLCQDKKVKRFIYTGTIDSLYLGPGAGTVSESTGVDSQISRRNNYAHSKAVTEGKLNALFKEKRFPVVIVRPAIVLGSGGPVTHVGVAQWFGLGRCEYWGNGENRLPIILVDDVVTGLVNAIDAEGIEGNTYNLSATSSITAREYVVEVEKSIGCKIKTSSSNSLTHWLMDSMKWVFKLFARHPDRSRVPSLRDWRCREQHADFDTKKAELDLNWKPVNDKETLIKNGIHLPASEFIHN